MNEEEMMMGLSDTGAGAGGMPPPAAAAAPEAGAPSVTAPAEEFADMLIQALRPVIVDVVAQLMAGVQE